jgi:hypothetical protein
VLLATQVSGYWICAHEHVLLREPTDTEWFA